MTKPVLKINTIKDIVDIKFYRSELELLAKSLASHAGKCGKRETAAVFALHHRIMLALQGLA